MTRSPGPAPAWWGNPSRLEAVQDVERSSPKVSCNDRRNLDTGTARDRSFSPRFCEPHNGWPSIFALGYSQRARSDRETSFDFATALNATTLFTAVLSIKP
jgi:hypothetical protein